jgi:hypothetical protein
MRRKGIITLFFLFIFFAVLLLVLLAFGIPMLMSMDVSFYGAGQSILQQINIGSLPNDTVTAQINQSITTASASIPQQISVLSYFFQYSWVIMIPVLGIIIFMYARTQVEQGQQGIQ